MGLADTLGQAKDTFVAELSQSLPSFIDLISTDGQGGHPAHSP
ncbi:hypothetical protein [Streptomyces phaeoluteigriseus]|nr:hypothetical protein [Streptomyces phaeoluteigriseus]